MTLSFLKTLLVVIYVILAALSTAAAATTTTTIQGLTLDTATTGAWKTFAPVKNSTAELLAAAAAAAAAAADSSFMNATSTTIYDNTDSFRAAANNDDKGCDLLTKHVETQSNEPLQMFCMLVMLTLALLMFLRRVYNELVRPISDWIHDYLLYRERQERRRLHHVDYKYDEKRCKANFILLTAIYSNKLVREPSLCQPTTFVNDCEVLVKHNVPGCQRLQPRRLDYQLIHETSTNEQTMEATITEMDETISKPVGQPMLLLTMEPANAVADEQATPAVEEPTEIPCATPLLLLTQQPTSAELVEQSEPSVEEVITVPVTKPLLLLANAPWNQIVEKTSSSSKKSGNFSTCEPLLLLTMDPWSTAVDEQTSVVGAETHNDSPDKPLLLLPTDFGNALIDDESSDMAVADEPLQTLSPASAAEQLSDMPMNPAEAIFDEKLNDVPVTNELSPTTAIEEPSHMPVADPKLWMTKLKRPYRVKPQSLSSLQLAEIKDKIAAILVNKLKLIAKGVVHEPVSFEHFGALVVEEAKASVKTDLTASVPEPLSVEPATNDDDESDSSIDIFGITKKRRRRRRKNTTQQEGHALRIVIGICQPAAHLPRLQADELAPLIQEVSKLVDAPPSTLAEPRQSSFVERKPLSSLQRASLPCAKAAVLPTRLAVEDQKPCSSLAKAVSSLASCSAVPLSNVNEDTIPSTDATIAKVPKRTRRGCRGRKRTSQAEK
ncbi:hypothetical protein MPSEU_000629300 [Mayamaea pseudoterrestris]|nr:hypothetical protein MPSEU_000629300 [Mayamaea pseudoterrestris]